MKKLAVIGAGSMSEALISGITESRLLEPENIWVTNRSNKEKLQHFHDVYGVSTSYELEELCTNADVILLAMKPKDALNALTSIKPYMHTNAVIISVLAGVSIESIEKIMDRDAPVVRAMPNTSATIGKSATALAVNEQVSKEQSEVVATIFQTVGLTKFVQEHQLDAVTGLSGSGPAYVYYFVEAMEKSAVELGLEADLAKDLIIQTFLGAAEMLSQTKKAPSQLRKEVTSPGGTTEAGLKVLADQGVAQALMNCVQEAAAQSKRLGDQINAEMNNSIK